MKLVALVLSAGLAAPLAAVASDYPTLDRVDAVLTCMQENGGQNIDNLQRCSCEIDMIMQQVDYDMFTEARTYEIYKQMPGDKGGIFRDNPRAKELVDKLNAARAEAKKRCFVGGVRQKNVPIIPPKKIAAPQ
ncbi:MAG TPA: hypothetical protein PJ986_04900 [Gammaproteobacteria bacterium]|nr:hypothetical protein [Gammaproteobacteria bacterium]